MADAHVLGALHRPGVQRAVPVDAGQGPDWAVGGVRPADADRLRPRPLDGARRSGQGRRAGGAPRPHGPAHGRHPARCHEHLHDDQRHRALAAEPLHRQRTERRGGGRGAAGHHPERHREGVPEPGHVHLPARGQPPAHRGRGGVLLGPCAAVEPDQRVQLPPAGGRRHAHPGDRLRAGHRDRRARRGARQRQGAPRAVRRHGGQHLVLRERRHPVHRRGLQGAGLHPDVGPDLRRALRRGRPQAAALPLRRAGELARAHRSPAREQRGPDHARSPGRDAVAAGADPLAAAACLERGAGAAATLGPAVVAADSAGAGARDRPAGVRRHLRRLGGGRGSHCRAD